MDKAIYRGIGIMSGTSLDGLDLAYCEFSAGTYKLLQAKTVEYTSDWKTKLQQAYSASAEQYFELHAAYGKYIANEVNMFIHEHRLHVDFIASHGHTIFHRPQTGFSTQIGCGATVAAHTGITTICDFRSLDVAHGGQGAPLVPIGDELLFNQYDACLNIGGIANISFRQDAQRRAFDICVANMALNHFSAKMGKPYDAGGEAAATGHVDAALLQALNAAQDQQEGRSLGREFFEHVFLPLTHTHTHKLSVQDLLATCSEHTAIQIAKTYEEHALKQMLISGGGAYNTDLIQRIKKHSDATLIIPDDLTIQFKEALIFAFLGWLRLHQKINTLRSVTGARQDSVGGAVYLGSH